MHLAPLDPWHVFSATFGSVPKPYTALATIADLVVYTGMISKVIAARIKFKINPPAIDGPEEFQRIIRVQANTAEQLVLHLPLLWIAAFAMDDMFAASLGAVWALSRILYARGYYQKPKRRFKGFMIGMIVNIFLLAGALMGTLGSL